MGSPLPPGEPAQAPLADLRAYAWTVPLRRRSRWDRWGRSAVLFVVTVASVFLAGALEVDTLSNGREALFFVPSQGLELALGLMAILSAHEMGHYLACRHYRVDATLPHFIPSPWIPVFGLAGWQPLSLVGTFGAFIRIRAPIPNRRALFDIGVAGPLAGFFVCLPVLLLGVLEGRVLPHASSPDDLGRTLGEPLLFQLIRHATHGPVPAGHEFFIGGLGLAAWFGLLVTALNLMPIGQLDGGHMLYAFFRTRSHLISRIGSWVCVILVYFSPSWILWAILVRLLSRQHPPTLDDELPLGRARVGIGLLAVVIFALSFTPSPVVFSWRDAFEATGLAPYLQRLGP